MIPASGCPPWPPDHPRTQSRTGNSTPPLGARSRGGHRRSSVRVRVAKLEPDRKMPMTDARMALLELIEKRADTDLVREMLAFAAERLMDLDVEAKTGVPAGQRSPERLN